MNQKKDTKEDSNFTSLVYLFQKDESNHIFHAEQIQDMFLTSGIAFLYENKPILKANATNFLIELKRHALNGKKGFGNLETGRRWRSGPGRGIDKPATDAGAVISLDSS